MVFKSFSVLVLWTKVASALKGLRATKVSVNSALKVTFAITSSFDEKL